MTSLKDKTYDTILAKLIDGRLVPGQTLDRAQLARELGVSPAPVLDAMCRLEAEGFLDVAPRKSTRVKVASEEDLVGQLVVREALECQVARMICGKRLKDAAGELRAMSIVADDLSLPSTDAIRADISFHLELARLARCVPLLESLERALTLGLFMSVSRRMPSRELTMQRHTVLLMELETDDPGVAEAAMRNHVRSGKPEGVHRIDAGPACNARTETFDMVKRSNG